MTSSRPVELPTSDVRGTTVLADTSQPEFVRQWIGQQLSALPVENVPVAGVRLLESPRRCGADLDHIQTMIEIVTAAPPIVVHRRTRRVIDGVHRVLAARDRGLKTIAARLYDGPDSEAFLLSVGLNVAHGLPLSRADRIAATERITLTHPEWSDRMIAGVTGLSATTVAAVRRRSLPDDRGPAARRGSDGRTRPLDIAAGRRLAEKLMHDNPTASLRAIAREAGVSPATAHDVRRRVAAGQSVVPGGAGTAARTRNAPGKVPPNENVDLDAALALLRDDPAIRFNEGGRRLVRWLERTLQPVPPWQTVIRYVPDHCTGLVASMARSYARSWSEFATSLDQRSPTNHR